MYSRSDQSQWCWKEMCWATTKSRICCLLCPGEELRRCKKIFLFYSVHSTYVNCWFNWLEILTCWKTTPRVFKKASFCFSKSNKCNQVINGQSREVYKWKQFETALAFFDFVSPLLASAAFIGSCWHACVLFVAKFCVQPTNAVHALFTALVRCIALMTLVMSSQCRWRNRWRRGTWCEED